MRGIKDPRLIDPQGLQLRRAPDRTQHAGRDGDLASDSRPRWRQDASRGRPRRDPERPSRACRLPGHGGVMTALLDVENLSVRYGDLVALRGASLTVSEGEVVCIIGPNGAGKSTTLATIAGGVTPVSGDIRLDGRTILGQRPEQIARLRLSLVPEGRHIFGTLTVAENLQIGGYMLGDRAAARSDMERLLDHFPRLRERLRYPAGRLSGGEQQMLAVARAVMTRPRLLLVDEPSLGLGPKIIDQIYEILLELRRREKLTLLLNEQSSARVLKFADHIYVLKGGAVGLEGRAADLRDGEAIRHAYFGFGDGERPVVTAA